MVRAAKSAELCTIRMAKENATPRFSIFRNKRMRGWWPFIKLRDQEDQEREEREDKQKKKRKSSSVKPEDLEFTDPSGNKYLLTVRQAAGAGALALPYHGNLYCSSDAPAQDFVQSPGSLSHLLQVQHFTYPEVPAVVACRGCLTSCFSLSLPEKRAQVEGSWGSKAKGSPSARQDNNNSLS